MDGLIVFYRLDDDHNHGIDWGTALSTMFFDKTGLKKINKIWEDYFFLLSLYNIGLYTSNGYLRDHRRRCPSWSDTVVHVISSLSYKEFSCSFSDPQFLPRQKLHDLACLATRKCGSIRAPPRHTVSPQSISLM